eukprot:COSAG03_NODE_11459_length_591_cov_1.256098_2_plen_90_part_00
MTFTVWFVGSEADRQKYTWTLVMESERGESDHRIEYTAQPLSIHEVRGRGFPDGPRCGRGVLKVWEDDLRLFCDGDGDPFYTITFIERP